jgi:peptidoglycan glycosyltransferase
MAQLAVAARRRRDPRRGREVRLRHELRHPADDGRLGLPAGPLDAQTGLTGFGQQNVQATPLQMAMVAAGIANKGIVMNPRMVDRVVAPDLTVQQTFEDTVRSCAERRMPRR